MASKNRDLFLTIRSEGAILPPDLLQRIVTGDRELEGLKPDDYHLPKSEKLNEATSRSWNRLVGAWASFRQAAEKLPESELGTSLTRERWLLPLFQELGYGRLLSAKAIEADGKSYPISHGWNRTPIHLLGWRVDLDRPQQRTAATSRSSAHSLLQETLNRSKDHLWGLVTNGLKLRVLRDNASLTRQAFVEFDLEAMMLGENYADFVLLWLLCHQSRVEAESPNDCWLERWSQASRARGVRALEQLRRGVEQAIVALGHGFLGCLANRKLKEDLRSGRLDRQDYYRQLLRLVYRLLFLFSAEDRGLLLLPGEVHAAARERYLTHYSTIRLRRLAERRTGTRHTDLYASLRLVMSKLGLDSGCPELALPALGSFLFSGDAMPDLENCDLSNFDLSEALRALAVTVANGVRRPVDYKNLGAEELGSVYESLLELHPRVNVDAPSFELDMASGHERKTSGSYYTPTSLIDCLLDSALEPVLDEAARKPDSEKAILGLKVVDPACGSGHFLIAAAHRIAKRLATARTGDEEPSPESTRTALRDVIGHCIYGVDVNPMAVELCKVSLWMEALDPGKPLSFLEHRLQCGNSLLGVTPALLRQGIPDDAFTHIEGDDKEICREFKRVNRDGRNKQMRLFAATTEPWRQLGNFAASLLTLDTFQDDSIVAIREKERLYREAIRSGHYLDGHFWADAWCAAFVWKKTRELSYPITEEIFRRIERNPHTCEPWMRLEIERLAKDFNFFHWHLAFPDVFRPTSDGMKPDNAQTGWVGGFDAVLGNPPWDKIQPEEVKFFAATRPDIASAKSASIRKDLIVRLAEIDPRLATDWSNYKRNIDATTHLLRDGKVLPLTTDGNLNTYRLFTELAYNLIGPFGYAGMVVQTGVATDESSKEFFGEVLSRGRIVRFLDFENRQGFFPEVDSRFRFALLTLCGATVVRDSPAGEFGWLLHGMAELEEPERLVHLTSEDVALFNPSSGTCPVFQSEHDLQINRQIYSRGEHISLDADHRFGAIEFLGELFNMTRDSRLFESQPDPREEYVPLYEAKCIHQFDHRYASQTENDFGEVPTTQKESALFRMVPRSWVRAVEVRTRLSRRSIKQQWMLGFRDVASATNERTAIAAIFPAAAVGNSINLILGLSAAQAALLSANINTFVFDFACRQKMSGMHVNIWIMKQLPAISLHSYTEASSGVRNVESFILARVLELTYTAYDLQPFARDVGCNGPPYCWNEERRFALRCELDALYFRLYGISRDDAVHIMDTFPLVRRGEEAVYGEYRSKRRILEIYDTMAEAELSGVLYQTALDPPPADPRVAHGFFATPVPVPQLQLPPPDLTAIAAGAWSTPQGVTPESIALLALVEVMLAFFGNASQAQVRLAATIVRKPAHALAFLEDERAQEWVRAIGNDARPLSANVFNISHFRPAAADQPWASAVTQLTATGAMTASSDRWIIGSNFPVSSGEAWIAGRAAFAVDLVSKVIAADLEERMTAFLRSVENGTARLAVS